MTDLILYDVADVVIFVLRPAKIVSHSACIISLAALYLPTEEFGVFVEVSRSFMPPNIHFDPSSLRQSAEDFAANHKNLSDDLVRKTPVHSDHYI